MKDRKPILSALKAKKAIVVLNGSASRHSANQRLIHSFATETRDYFELKLFEDLKLFPHFDPELSTGRPPQPVEDLRQVILEADGALICTPEYVFSIPSGLKNVLEWCVSTTVWSGKPTGLVTASAHGQKAHEELQLIMKTLMASFTEETTLLIPGIKGKISPEGAFTDAVTKEKFQRFVGAFKAWVFTEGPS